MRPAFLTALLLTTSAAHAVMPPEVYQGARADAAYHVQVAIAKVSLPQATPGSCAVDGKIVRIFRDKGGGLSKGQPVSFSVSCSRPDDDIPAGGVLWEDAERLASANYLEVYLNGSEPDFEVALYQSQIIDGPSDTPQFP